MTVQKIRETPKIFFIKSGRATSRDNIDMTNKYNIIKIIKIRLINRTIFNIFKNIFTFFKI